MTAIWGIICIENGRKNDLEGENQHIQEIKGGIGSRTVNTAEGLKIIIMIIIKISI